MEITIYAILCPITQAVKYVGKSVNLKNRIYQHTCKSGRLKNRKLSNWIDKLAKERNVKPIFQIIEICDETNWESREMFWIKHYQSIYSLCNHTRGGEGCHGRKMSDELRAKISATHKGKKKKYKCVGGVKNHSEETKLKISQLKTGKKIAGKRVLLTSKQGNITEYNTLSEASAVTGIKITSISNNLKGYSKSTKIGTWNYKTI